MHKSHPPFNMTMNLLNDNPVEAWDVKRENPEDTSIVSHVPSTADSKKKRSWKKPKDKPMRPLSAYNMFFRKLYCNLHLRGTIVMPF